MRGQGRGSRPFWGTAIAVTLLAPALLYLIVRMIPTPLPPADPLLAAHRAVYESILPNARVRDREVALARAAALHAPLAFEPFFLAARAAEQRGNLQGAIALMEEVRRRRASFVPGRLQLAIYYGMANRFSDMFSEMDVALRLNTDVRQAIILELTRLLAVADARNALAMALARDPEWREDFFRAALTREIDPDDAYALLATIRQRSPRANRAMEWRLYLTALVRAGQVARARQLWLNGLPADVRGRSALLFDGGFGGARTMPLFGWQLRQTEAGRAEIVRGERPHLEVNYFGGSNEILAEQVIALPPARYRLSFGARSDEGVADAELYWVINCYPGEAILVRAPIAQLSGSWQRRSAAFEVPAGCTGQRLRLIAEPGDIAVPIMFQVASVEIAR